MVFSSKSWLNRRFYLLISRRVSFLCCSYHLGLLRAILRNEGTKFACFLPRPHVMIEIVKDESA